MKNWFKYLTKKQRRAFILLTIANGTLFFGGIVLMCFGYESGVYGFITLITYIPYYFSSEELGETRSQAIK